MSLPRNLQRWTSGDLTDNTSAASTSFNSDPSSTSSNSGPSDGDETCSPVHHKVEEEGDDGGEDVAVISIPRRVPQGRGGGGGGGGGGMGCRRRRCYNTISKLYALCVRLSKELSESSTAKVYRMLSVYSTTSVDGMNDNDSGE